MSLKSIKSKTQAQKGFTIVELLIVVVVIAILAAITIVSYNGITSRANTSAATAAAATVQKKAELFAADGPTGKYPTLFTELSGATSEKTFALSGIDATTGPTVTPTAANGTKTVRFLKCGPGAGQSLITQSTIVGIRITYFNYTTSLPVDLDVGTATNCPAAA
jgi:prepilin-type N-terminal cleavage/methylation domain-containing protein